jgi:hypothetical protein
MRRLRASQTERSGSSPQDGWRLDRGYESLSGSAHMGGFDLHLGASALFVDHAHRRFNNGRIFGSWLKSAHCH